MAGNRCCAGRHIVMCMLLLAVGCIEVPTVWANQKQNPRKLKGIHGTAWNGQLKDLSRGSSRLLLQTDTNSSIDLGTVNNCAKKSTHQQVCVDTAQAAQVKAVVTCDSGAPLVVKVKPEIGTATAQEPACFKVSARVCTDMQCLDGPLNCTISWVDADTNAAIGEPFVLSVFVNGTDTEAPVISPELKPPLTLECPTQYTPPNITATDNCGEPQLSAYAISGTTADCPYAYAAVYTWEATDKSGNTARVSQTVFGTDTLPPAVVDAQCANYTACIATGAHSSGPVTVCIPSSTWKSCFSDACSGDDITVVAACGTCSALEPTTSSQASISATCKASKPATAAKTGKRTDVSADSNQVCITMASAPATGAACCSLTTTATDRCGNSVTIDGPQLCVYSKASSVRDLSCKWNFKPEQSRSVL